MDSWHAASIPSLPGLGPPTLVWDTASRACVVAARDHVATIYACGITPYDATHIGHAATYIAWDLLIRSWLDSGHEVRYAQNVTDVDDPLLERAARDGDDWRELADREIERYRADMAALRVLPPDYFVGAVEALDVIEEFAGLLGERGSLYEVDDDVYAARSADALFGSVSGLGAATMLELCAERGGDPGRPGKKDPLDPLVWLAARPGEPQWPSRFGPGRPGWHVECAAIASRWLGPVFDVQAGGSDLIFPHHEMSASHARIAFGDTDGEVFARRYVHAGMVRYDGEKMSKSLGNLVFVSALRESGTDPMAIRLAILAHHYRGDWDWTDQVLREAAERLARWRAAIGAVSGPRTSQAASSHPDSASAATPHEPLVSAAARPDGDGVLAAVRERMADDLDAPGALAVIDAWAGSVLAGTASGDQVRSAGLVKDTVDALLGVSL
jgi:L-cysteine:1D-myo-inositol 2-amino-2-deoxy-alpha-D-glucopyranoside ligase